MIPYDKKYNLKTRIFKILNLRVTSGNNESQTEDATTIVPILFLVYSVSIHQSIPKWRLNRVDVPLRTYDMYRYFHTAIKKKKIRPCARVNLCPGGYSCCIKLDGLSNLKYR